MRGQNDFFDTNVISELIRPSPDSAVVNWASNQNPSSCYISAVTAMELRYGVAVLPEGKRKDDLAIATESMLQEDFAGRVLAFDEDASVYCALIRADRKRIGRRIGFADAQIASIARSSEAVLATRNEKVFSGCGIEVINPWI